MRISYQTMLNWLKGNAEHCTTNQLQELGSLINQASNKAYAEQRRRQEALEQVQAAAKAAGFDSLEELLRKSGSEGADAFSLTSPAHNTRKNSPPPRRPYLDPCDSMTKAWSLAHRGDNMPAWVNRRLAEGWTLEELHYKRIRAARIARKLPPDEPYNPIEKHAELMRSIEVVPRPQRRG